MTRPLLAFMLALSLVAAITPSIALSANKVPTLGVLIVGAQRDDPVFEGLWQGLREAGYVEGRTIRIEFRTAQGQYDRLGTLAAELVRLKADVILVGSTRAAQEAQRATASIPIVMAIVADPVGSGLVTNLARPGGNVTGLSSMVAELSAKRLELLKEAVPDLARVAVLWDPDTPYHRKTLAQLRTIATSLPVEISFVPVKRSEDMASAFETATRAHAQALYVLDSPVFYNNRTTLLKLASAARLPAIYPRREFASAGGILSYGASIKDAMRRAASYVDRILKGAKPGDLPIEQPDKLELVVNLKTAKALGLTIPQSILLRADELIR